MYLLNNQFIPILYIKLFLNISTELQIQEIFKKRIQYKHYSY